MALKIRLRQQGRTNYHVYRLVVIDSRQARDGKYVEALGWYNPRATKEDQTLSVKPDRVQHWITCGAELTDKAEALIQQAAPEVLRHHREKQQAQSLKLTAKRRARRSKQKG